MKQISELIKNKTFGKQQGQPRNEREEFLQLSLEKINKSRVGTKYKPLSFLSLKLKVKYLTDKDLKYHYFQCKKSDNFSRLFFGLLRTK